MKLGFSWFVGGSVVLIALLAGCGQRNVVTSNPEKFNALPDAVEQPVTDTVNWSSWRGPHGNGVAVDQTPPTSWSSDENILWKSKVPGRGHSSPTILDDRIYLTTSSVKDQTQSLVCFDRMDGKLLWNQTVHQGGLAARIHTDNTHASATVTSDGKDVFCKFVNKDRVFLSKYNAQGNRLWQKDVGGYRSGSGFGSGSSPVFWKDRIILCSETSGESFMVALDPSDGSEKWRVDRNKVDSYSTPVVANVAGKFQLLISGGQKVQGYDPDSGELLWSCPADWKVSCGTLVWDDDVVIASGGFPVAQTLAVRGDGSGERVWQHQVKCYEQSLLAHEGYVYALNDSGICYCWEASTGKRMWKKRMKSNVSASPVLAGGHLYFPVEDGTCFVIKANPQEYELVAENVLGQSAMATPTFVDNKIYARVGTGPFSDRQEWLYCIGQQ